MAKPLSILYVSSELFPFAKIGGIGDVAYSLPIAIREEGHDIRVMMPKYGIISERRNKIHEINRLKDMEIHIGDDTYLATVKSSSIVTSKIKVQAYISTNNEYFESRKGIYADLKTSIDYPDNDERFTFFSKTVVETCNMLGWVPDIIHANDWQTGLIAAFAKLQYPKKFAKTRFILTIHNVAYQGEYPKEFFSKLLIPEKEKDKFIHNGKLNFLKAGILFADAVNTVSHSYCDEIINGDTPSNGLNEILKSMPKKFYGIINGIDVEGWNPKTDKKIHFPLEDDIIKYKLENKKFILEQFKLEHNENIPLIGLSLRLNEQRGIDVLLKALPKILEQNVQVILTGDGEAKYKDEIKTIQEKYSDNFAYKFGYDETTTHYLEAGSDFFLIPSKCEPCGLNAMYSIIYGTVPIVHCVGGLNEIVQDYNPKNEEGNGFKFEDLNTKSIISTIKKALKLYNNKDKWYAFLEKNMQTDYSWKDSVKEYINMYFNALKDKE